MPLEDYIKKYSELEDDALNLWIDFVKQIIATSGVLLALLLALTAQPLHSKPIFRLTVLLLLLAIVFALIHFYIAIIQRRRLHKDFLASILKHIQVGYGSPKPLFSKYNTILGILGKASVLCFFFGILCLIIFYFYPDFSF